MERLESIAPICPDLSGSFLLMLLLAKLSLVALSLLIATAVSRRFGHRVGGIVAGFPMIMAPLIGILLIDLEGQRVAEILWATLANQPACVAYVMGVAWAALRFNWWQAAFMGSLAFSAATALASLVPLPVMVLLSLLIVLSASRLMPAAEALRGPVAIPTSEFVVRMVAALGMAAGVVMAADHTPAWVSAMLLTFPINGSILPAFTQALYGGPAARALLRGFSRGLVGVAFFVLATATALSMTDKWLGYAIGVGCALGYAILLASLDIRKK
jgi:hypothetical protein